MSEDKHITVSDLSSGETILQLIQQKWPSVSCFFPNTIAKFKDLPYTELIVTWGGKEQLTSLLENDLFNLGADFLDGAQQDLLNTFPTLKS
jgi:hypothetical protein